MNKVLSKKKSISILGIRGVPAAHGGFETFAEYLSLYLRDKGWAVTVYCQVEGGGEPYCDYWEGIRRVNIPVIGDGPYSTIKFDWKSVGACCKDDSSVVLTLGYNTAVFCARLRIAGRVNVINMDGIEWKRDKWGVIPKLWFWANDWAGCFLGNHLVADHPEIKKHLETRVNGSKITVLPYGAERVEDADCTPLGSYGVCPGRYLTVIARPEPENSIYEIVKAFSRSPRGISLVVLGTYKSDNEYHKKVRAVASDEVKFVGAIYDKKIVRSLRRHSLMYVHGHQVGGTNPSLVEALGASNPVVAHDNKFNRWVADDAAVYFGGEDECAAIFDTVLSDESALASMRFSSSKRFESEFTWEKVLSEYEVLLLDSINGK